MPMSGRKLRDRCARAGSDVDVVDYDIYVVDVAIVVRSLL